MVLHTNPSYDLMFCTFFRPVGHSVSVEKTLDSEPGFKV